MKYLLLQDNNYYFRRKIPKTSQCYTFSLKSKNAIQSGYKVNYEVYRKDLKEAVLIVGEQWQHKGSHGLRYNFAQETLSQNGASRAELSLAMSHLRIGVLEVYLE